MNITNNSPKVVKRDQSKLFSIAMPFIAAGCLSIGFSPSAYAKDHWRIVVWDRKSELLYFQNLRTKTIYPTSIKDIRIADYNQLRQTDYKASKSIPTTDALRQQILENGIGWLNTVSTRIHASDRIAQTNAAINKKGVWKEGFVELYGSSQTVKLIYDLKKTLSYSANEDVKSIDQKNAPPIKPVPKKTFGTKTISFNSTHGLFTKSLSEAHAKNAILEKTISEQALLIVELNKKVKALTDGPIEEVGPTRTVVRSINSNELTILTFLLSTVIAFYKPIKSALKFLFGWKIKVQIVRPVL